EHKTLSVSWSHYQEYVARELNQTDYGDFPSVSEVNRNILRRLHYVLWQSQAKLTIEVNNLETLLMEVAQRSADQNNYLDSTSVLQKA
ncbi:TPA: hypothetical protein ACTN0J_004808, partial [Escherichia coli]